MKRIHVPQPLAERTPEEQAAFRLYAAIEEPLLQLDRAILALDDMALHAFEADGDLNPQGVLFIAEAMRQQFDAVKAGLTKARSTRLRKPRLALVPGPAA